MRRPALHLHRRLDPGTARGEFCRAGGQLDVRNETRREFLREDPDHPWWYRAISPIPGNPDFPRGLFLEVKLIERDEDEPWVQI